MVGTYVVLAGVLAVSGLLVAPPLLARRDHRYAGLMPGQLPAEGAAVAVEAARSEQPVDVEVRCLPPIGISPGEAGVLLRRRTSLLDVRATLIDLEARGYVRVVDGAEDRMLTVGRAAGAGLRPHERALLAALFPNTEAIRLSTSERLLTQVTADVEAALARSVVARGWFSRLAAGRFPVGMVVFGLLLAYFLGAPLLTFTFALAGVDSELALVALLMAVPAGAALLLRRRSGRLPAGYAAHHQVLGFRRYLENAEPSVAERYLPWTVAFGLATADALPDWHGVESWL